MTPQHACYTTINNECTICAIATRPVSVYTTNL